MLAMHSFRDLTLNIFNLIFEKLLVPSLWLQAIVVALLKKGSRFMPKNYRPISLVDTYGKLFGRKITSRLSAAIDERLGMTQFGFRKGWGGLSNIY